LHCLVLDLHMPELDGFEVLRTIATRRLFLPVIAITGHDIPGTAERVLKLGAAAYLLKPMDETLLVDAIRRVL
jgi:FixJ family two-component response regulator